MRSTFITLLLGTVLLIGFNQSCGTSSGTELSQELQILSESSSEKTVRDEPANAQPEASEETTGSDASEPKTEQPGTTEQPSITEQPTDSSSSPCPRKPGAADRTRRIVVSHPFGANRKKVGLYEVMTLSPDGQITRDKTTFNMGVSVFGNILFTPDGLIGMVPQDGGTIGVFRFNKDGKVEVVHKEFKGKFYATKLVMGPQGRKVYVLNGNWRNNGGGVYVVNIGCDGTLTDEGLLFPAKLPLGMVFVPNDPSLTVLAAKDALTSQEGPNTHLIRLSSPPKLFSSVDAFGDKDAVISAEGITVDGKFALFGDNSAFTNNPNRVAIVAIQGEQLKKEKVVTPIKDPSGIVASPYNNVVLLLSGEGNALYRLPYNPNSQPAFGTHSPIQYNGRRPQLPTAAQLMLQGKLKDRVFIAENKGIRQVLFEKDGTIKDLGIFDTGEGFVNVVGTLGVQP